MEIFKRDIEQKYSGKNVARAKMDGERKKVGINE